MLVDDLNKGFSSDHRFNIFVQGAVLNNGERRFDVKEIEVFKIEYI